MGMVRDNGKSGLNRWLLWVDMEALVSSGQARQASKQHQPAGGRQGRAPRAGERGPGGMERRACGL